MQRGDLRTRLDAQLRVEVRQRFVHQEHLRLAHDRTAHRNALTLAAGEVGRLAVEEVVEVEDSSRLLDAPAPVLLVDLLHLEVEADVLGHGHVRVQRVRLEDHRDVAILRRHIGDVSVADQDVAVVDRLESGQHPQRRGLSAARGADEHEELAVADLEVEGIHGRRIGARIGPAGVLERDGGQAVLLVSWDVRASRGDSIMAAANDPERTLAPRHHRVAMSEVALFGRLAHRWVGSPGCDERSGAIRAVGSSLGGAPSGSRRCCCGSPCETATVSDLVHLHGATFDLVVDVATATPTIVHWGQPLGDGAELAALDVVLGRPAVAGALGSVAPISVVPLHADGFVGRPGLAGRRGGGRDWAPRFVPTAHRQAGNALTVESHDGVAGLTLTTEISATDVVQRPGDDHQLRRSPLLARRVDGQPAAARLG